MNCYNGSWLLVRIYRLPSAKGEKKMGDKGKMDKAKREVQKKAKLTLMEKRKQKKEKKKEK